MTKRKNKSNNEKEYSEIKEYYKKALSAFESNEPELGVKIVLTMPVLLYDMSLDILENKNGEFSDQELRDLISKVDVLLVADHPERDEDSDIPDIFDNYFLDNNA